MKYKAPLTSLVVFLLAAIWFLPSRAELSDLSRARMPIQREVSPIYVQSVQFAESRPARELTQIPPIADEELVREKNEAHEVNELNTERVRKLTPENAAKPSFDATLPTKTRPRKNQEAPEAITLGAPSLTFDGIAAVDEGNSVAPPDTEGDVGPNDYVQAVNNRVRVYDKNGNPRGVEFTQSSLFASAGGLASMVDDGDPIVLYDRMANRWLISQFAFLSSTSPPFHEAIAISETGDPTGKYFLYDFVLPGNEFPDYPKFGVWPDGYYMTSNQFLNGGPFDGAGAFAFDRKKMLVGDPTAGLVYFDLNVASHPEGIFGMLPSDQDGLLPPPAGSPNVFLYFTNVDFGDPADGVRLFNFHADFTTPANSTFIERPESTYAAPVALAAYDARIPGGRGHVKQPPPAGNNNTDRLDSVGERMMDRLQYVNRNGVESLVSNFTVNVSGVTPNSGTNYQAGFRYFELTKSSPSAPYTVNEQATFAPGSGAPATGPNRWMASAALDNQGNLAVGYSVSSTTIFPSLKYAGRAFNDAPGGLFQGEFTMFAGPGVQRQTSNRWGDYSTLQLDPSDDCTMWFTSEYYTTNNQTFNWRTRIGRFKFSTCTPPAQGTLTGTIRATDHAVLLGNAMVTATGGPSNGFSSTTLSNGTYSFNLAPGTYTVNVAALPDNCSGAGPFTVTINNGQTTILNANLAGLPKTQFVNSAVSGGNGNGIVEADECNNLSLTVTNVGCATASHVLGTVTTTTPGVTITQPHSNYPDMIVGATASNTIPFSMSTSPSFVCGTAISLTLNLTYTTGSASFNFSIPTCSCPTQTQNGSITNSDGLAVSRLGRTATSSSCTTAKACPGPIDAVQRHYHLHTFTNGPTAACVTVTVTAGCSSATNPIIPVAYLGSFVPSNLCTNYLGDPGSSPAPTISWQVAVPASATLVISVQEVNANTGCSGYSVSVSGLVCNTSSTAQCPVFNTCIQDDVSGNILMWNSTTGAYQYIVCGPSGTTLTGTGTAGVASGVLTLTDNKPTQKISATFNPGQHTGRANISFSPSPGITQTVVLNQTNPNATCACH